MRESLTHLNRFGIDALESQSGAGFGGPEIGAEQTSVQTQAPQSSRCVPSGKFVNLSELQFPPWSSEDNTLITVWGCWEGWIRACMCVLSLAYMCSMNICFLKSCL